MSYPDAIVVFSVCLTSFGFAALWLEHTRRMFQIKNSNVTPGQYVDFITYREVIHTIREDIESINRNNRNLTNVVGDVFKDIAELKTKQNGESLKDGLKLK